MAVCVCVCVCVCEFMPFCGVWLSSHGGYIYHGTGKKHSQLLSEYCIVCAKPSINYCQVLYQDRAEASDMKTFFHVIAMFVIFMLRL